MSISASAVLSLQTRINNERSRRGLSSAGFTGGVTSGSNIRAPHINELRSYTETLNTMGSVSFGWSGNVAAGADITDALSQISSYCTTLENEALASWKTLTPISYTGGNSATNGTEGRLAGWMFQVPTAAFGANKVRLSFPPIVYADGCTGNPASFDYVAGAEMDISSVTTCITNTASPTLDHPGSTFSVAHATAPGIIEYHSNIKDFRKGQMNPSFPPDASIWCSDGKYINAIGITERMNVESMYARFGYATHSLLNQGVYFYNETGGFDSSWKYLLIALGIVGSVNAPLSEIPIGQVITVEAYY